MKQAEQSRDVLGELHSRRRFIREAAAGTVVAALGGLYYFSEQAAYGGPELEPRKDGRARVPPGQRVIRSLKPMGGEPGSALRKDFRLSVSGEVEEPFELTFEQLLEVGVTEVVVDVHCVTGWTVLGARFRGVRVDALAARAKLKPSARHIVFEAAHGYTANVPLREGLAPNVLVAHELDGQPLRQPHGAPVRALVPDLYFWKSPKWLTGIRFTSRDEPGYWERRGYNNHGDPWREERYA